MNWLQEHARTVAALTLLAVGIWWLIPRPQPRSRLIGLLLAAAGAGWLLFALPVHAGPLTHRLLFWVFAGGALISAVLMVTSARPFYAALWFALVTLATSGLFLLQSAPFLAAATVIVYAGAIIVTFLFVIMLAQQEGARAYDCRARQPLLATVGAFVLLGALLATIGTLEPESAAQIPRPLAANPLSYAPETGADGTMHALGPSLFGDYLFAVELAGTVLLVAAVGAIAIAPRRSQGTL